VNSAQPGLDYVYDHPALTGQNLRLETLTTSSSLSPTGRLVLSRQIEDWAGQWIRITPVGGGTDAMSITLKSSVPLRAKAVLRHQNGGVAVLPFTTATGGVALTVPDIASYSSVVVMPVLMGKTTGFSTGEEDGTYPQEPNRTYTAEFVRGVTAPLLTPIVVNDGDLIRAEGDFRVWIVQGGWRRHIVDARVFGFYDHLGFSSVKVVSPTALAAYRVSAWVRVPVTANPLTWRVYEVNADASRHWITCANPDFCEGTWRSRGGDPAGIFTINQREMDFYTTGSHVFLQ
jgi:hypothetical protein